MKEGEGERGDMRRQTERVNLTKGREEIKKKKR